MGGSEIFFSFPSKKCSMCALFGNQWGFFPVALEYNLKQVYKLIFLLFPVFVVMVVCQVPCRETSFYSNFSGFKLLHGMGCCSDLRIFILGTAVADFAELGYIFSNIALGFDFSIICRSNSCWLTVLWMKQLQHWALEEQNQSHNLKLHKNPTHFLPFFRNFKIPLGCSELPACSPKNLMGQISINFHNY